jgi:DNA-binding NarL/FixJ family response regulator
MPGLDGIEATRAITSDESVADVRVLVLTTFQYDQYVFAALRAGASGFLGKDAEPDDLIDAIRTVHAGESLLSAVALRALIGRFLAEPEPDTGPSAAAVGSLTEREREVLVLVARGLSNDDIAARLMVSPHTVKTHVNRAMAKLGAHGRAQLVIAAYAAGLLPPPAAGR